MADRYCTGFPKRESRAATTPMSAAEVGAVAKSIEANELPTVGGSATTAALSSVSVKRAKG